MKAALVPPPFEPLPPPPAPLTAAGEYEVGDSVWYHDERYYVEWAPDSWDTTSTVHISDMRIVPGRIPDKSRRLFSVHADLLSKAPVTKNAGGRQPTKAALTQREEKRKTGQRDNGDEVSQMLRSVDSLDEAFALASAYLGVPISDLQTKYAHLDNGRKRMCLGNLMRGKSRRA
jgi:hypothetical protein